jgi:hypothetical protein
MGFLDKIMFWKKNDSIDLNASLDLGPDPLAGQNLGMGMNASMGQEQTPSYGNYPSAHTFDDSQFGSNPQFTVRDVPRQEPFSPQNYAAEKNLEVISSKLDALKAGMESINQRLANIERIAQGEQEHQMQRRRNYW